MRCLSEGGLHRPIFAPPVGGDEPRNGVVQVVARRLYRTAVDLREALRRIMADMHEKCVEDGRDGSRVDYVRGANIAAFRKVAGAMLAFGPV